MKETIRRVIIPFGVWLAACGIAYSQLRFDAASVKIAKPVSGARMGIAGGPGTSDPERITFRFCTLKYLLLYAYAPAFDIVTYKDDPVITGPSWIADGETYDILAKVSAGSTEEQVRVMLQNLLADRFRLVIRKESKEVSGYELSVAKGGPKLMESADSNAPRNREPQKLDKDQFPIVPEGTTDLAQSKGYVTARNQSIFELRRFVALKLGTYPSTIVDHTGLTRTYDFRFRTVPGGPPFPGARPPEGADGGPSIFEALEKQLGLELEKKKVAMEIFVVVSADRTPADN